MITTTLAAVGRQLSRTASYIPSVSCCLFRREREREGREKKRRGREVREKGRGGRRGEGTYTFGTIPATAGRHVVDSSLDLLKIYGISKKNNEKNQND